MKRVLVTGGDGFIASALVPKLLERGWLVRAAVMEQAGVGRVAEAAEGIVTGDLGLFLDWEHLLDGVDAVVHLAARVHASPAGPQEWESYRRDNVSVTRSLAEACVRLGVRRFVLASSVKALGEQTPPGQAWDETRPFEPRDSYGRSKAEAERSLREASDRSRLEPVILRLPLVYGPGMRANMLRLFDAVYSGWPLPLAGIENSRSILFLGNLCDALTTCLEHPAAVGETFHVADAEALSTPDLVRRIARSLGRPCRLYPLPKTLARAAAAILRRTSELERLTGSLVLDTRNIRAKAGWKPLFTVEEGLQATSRWFLGTRR